jgi:purine-nucleoside phosphorylase
MQAGYGERVKRAVAAVRRRTEARPSVGLILGSGLSGILERFEGVDIGYGDIQGFPVPSVEGHRGLLRISDGIAVCAGRFHYYEGLPMDDVVMPVFLLSQLGVKTLVITNAAGAINPELAPGDIVLIRDHLNLMGAHPLRGPNDAAFGLRFPDMSNAYTPALRRRTKQLAVDRGLAERPLPEGVYAALSGPSYETPAEIRMLAVLGADLVGMSTVPEVIAASYLGLDVVGFSCVTNLAAGLSGAPLDHREVVETGKRIERTLGQLLAATVEAFSEAKP